MREAVGTKVIEYLTRESRDHKFLVQENHPHGPICIHDESCRQNRPTQASHFEGHFAQLLSRRQDRRFRHQWFRKINVAQNHGGFGQRD